MKTRSLNTVTAPAGWGDISNQPTTHGDKGSDSSDSTGAIRKGLGHCQNVPLTCANTPTVTVVTVILHMFLHTRIMRPHGATKFEITVTESLGHWSGDLP